MHCHHLEMHFRPLPFRKLLKEHESKYEPLGHDESFKIMEEILAMQVGITPDGVSIPSQMI